MDTVDIYLEKAEIADAQYSGEYTLTIVFSITDTLYKKSGKSIWFHNKLEDKELEISVFDDDELTDSKIIYPRWSVVNRPLNLLDLKPIIYHSNYDRTYKLEIRQKLKTKNKKNIRISFKFIGQEKSYDLKIGGSIQKLSNSNIVSDISVYPKSILENYAKKSKKIELTDSNSYFSQLFYSSQYLNSWQQYAFYLDHVAMVNNYSLLYRSLNIEPANVTKFKLIKFNCYLVDITTGEKHLIKEENGNGVLIDTNIDNIKLIKLIDVSRILFKTKNNYKFLIEMDFNDPYYEQIKNNLKGIKDSYQELLKYFNKFTSISYKDGNYNFFTDSFVKKDAFTDNDRIKYSELSGGCIILFFYLYVLLYKKIDDAQNKQESLRNALSIECGSLKNIEYFLQQYKKLIDQLEKTFSSIGNSTISIKKEFNNVISSERDRFRLMYSKKDPTVVTPSSYGVSTIKIFKQDINLLIKAPDLKVQYYSILGKNIANKDNFSEIFSNTENMKGTLDKFLYNSNTKKYMVLEGFESNNLKKPIWKPASKIEKDKLYHIAIDDSVKICDSSFIVSDIFDEYFFG